MYIYGKSIGECKGKTTAAKPELEADVPIPFAEVPVFQTVYIDLMFENGLVFIIVVCKPLNYTFVGLVKSRKAKDIWVEMSKGLCEIANMIHQITIGYMDGEKATQSEELKQWVWKQFHFELDIGGAAEAIYMW